MIRIKEAVLVCCWPSILIGLVTVSALGFNTSTIALASETIQQEERLFAKKVSEQEAIEMSFSDGKLRCRVQSAPQKHVLEELIRICDVEVSWPAQELKKKISMEFADLSLDKAVKKILSDWNYALTRTSNDKGKNLVKILIFSRAEGGEEALLAESIPETYLPEMVEGIEKTMMDAPKEDEASKNLVDALKPLLFEEDKRSAIEKVMRVVNNNPESLFKMLASVRQNEFASVPLDELIDTDFDSPGPILRKQTVEYLTSTTHTGESQEFSDAISKLLKSNNGDFK